MKRTATTINYCIDIPSKKLLKVIQNDRELIPQPLYRALMDIEGVEKADYDGHFGPYIFIELDVQYDDGKTWNLIESVIRSHSKRIR